MIIFCQILLFVAFYVIAKHLLSKTQNLPPSPFRTLPIVGHLYLLKKPLHRPLTRLSNRYGPIIHLTFGSRKVLVVSSPCAAEECLATNDIIFANCPRLLIGKLLGYKFTSLAWAPYGDHWRNLRRISSLQLLSSHRLKTLSRVLTDEVRSLVRGLLPTNNNNQNQTEEKRERFMQSLIEEHKRMGCDADAEKDKKKKKTMIGVLLDLKESEPEYYNDKMIRGIMLHQHNSVPVETVVTQIIMLEICTCTGPIIRWNRHWAMSLLFNNPEVLKKAQAEIDNLVGHDRLLDESNLAKLPYLRCIINETLRMYPAAPLVVPHESSEDCQVIDRDALREAISRIPSIWDEQQGRAERVGPLHGACNVERRRKPCRKGLGHGHSTCRRK
ncbi:hypothetical protein I3842_15G046800 [Carya illinoinensis]|uniref:Cytochrome P450 n=1 Tax=Carya illinoinensis TaxID=32201 RepID=A0A922D1T1_CARIL|nr:hypothetical protein I3842_15G046800 [Carya illinoinensis]